MKIHYSENDSEETEILLNEFTNTLSLKGLITSDTYLDIVFPFKLSRISPKFKVLDDFQEEVLVFRNNNFSEYDICEIRNSIGDIIGLFFKPSIIFDDDAKYLFKDNTILQVCIFRSFINLMKDNISLKSNNIKESREVDYNFDDFIPSDVIFGVFPHEWNEEFNRAYVTQILTNISLFGFYYLNHKNDFDFVPPISHFHSSNFASLASNKFHYKPLKLVDLSSKVKYNPYFYHYLNYIIKENSNAVSKFHQIYGLIEIFKDEVLKLEIAEKICVAKINSTATGHQIQQDILAMSRDSYNINKLFSKYRKSSNENLEIMLWEICFFLDSIKKYNDIKDIHNFPQAYYYLRNIIVHDIQFLFTGEEEQIKKMREDFKKLTASIEYLIIETLCYLEI